MRTFVAIELDEDCRHNLATAIDQLEDAVEDVKWVDADAAHLTLKFIGQLDEEDVPTAVSVLEEAASHCPPFSMRVAGLSAFPSERKPRVIFACVTGPDDILAELAEAVDSRLAKELGTDREQREFVPHVSLGRVRKGNSCPPLDDISSAVSQRSFGRVSVEEIVLMKSDLTPRGAVYTPLEHVVLGA